MTGMLRLIRPLGRMTAPIARPVNVSSWQTSGLGVREPFRSIRSASTAARPTRSCFLPEPEPLLGMVTLRIPPPARRLFLLRLSHAHSCEGGRRGTRPWGIPLTQLGIPSDGLGPTKPRKGMFLLCSPLQSPLYRPRCSLSAGRKSADVPQQVSQAFYGPWHALLVDLAFC